MIKLLKNQQYPEGSFNFFTIVAMIFLYWTSSQFLAEKVYATRLVGNQCGRSNCKDLLKQLESKWSNYVQKFKGECTGDKFLTLNLRNDVPIVNFVCWEAKVATGAFAGQRSGYFLGALPYPTQEASFPIAVKSSDPKIQAVLAKHPKTIKQFAFDCATHYGESALDVSGGLIKRLELGCFSQAGAEFVDTNGDWISDGENSRGASVMHFVRTIYFLDLTP